MLNRKNIPGNSLTIKEKSDVEISFFKDDYLASTVSFQVVVVFSLQGLVENNEKIEVQNDVDNPWKVQPETEEIRAFSPSEKNRSSELKLFINNGGIFIFQYKLAGANSLNGKVVSVNGNETDLNNTEDFTLRYFPLPDQSENVVIFKYIVGDANSSFDFQLANIKCEDNSQQVLDLSYNESFGSVTLIKGLDEFFNPPGVTVNVGEVVRLIAEVLKVITSWVGLMRTDGS